MVFFGIIEHDKQVVREIIDALMDNGEWCLLFACTSLNEYKTLSVVKRTKVHIVFMDSGENNFERLWQIRYLKQTNPRSHIITLLERSEDEYASYRMIQTGASGYLYKDAPGKEIKTYTEKILNERSADQLKSSPQMHKPQIAPVEPSANVPLTLREFEIVELVVKGHTNKKIGEMMHISHYTVNAHLRKIYTKFSVNSRTELISQIINDLV